MKRIKLIGGDEYDALTKAKKYYHWKPGERKKIKRRYNKRFRKYGYDGKHHLFHSPIAQLVEQGAVNALVAGSSPARGATAPSFSQV